MAFSAKKMFYSLIIPLLLGWTILMGYVYTAQKSLIFFPEKELAVTPGDIGLKYEDVILKTKDSINIHAWLVPAEKARGVVLFCHGNAGNISHRLDSIRIFNGLNLDVFIFDYRGYGRSGGTPSEDGTYLDAEAAWIYLTDILKIPPQKIVLFGRSLGGAVAIETAIRRKAGVLIVESSFTSLIELGQTFYPYLPVKLLARYKYSNIEKIGALNIPTLFVHSPDDEIIPYAHGVRLYEKAREPKDFLKIGGSHNWGFITHQTAYIEGLSRFLSLYLR